MPPTSAAGGDRTDSAPPAPRANPPRAEPRISPKPFFCAGAAAAVGVMIGVSIPSSSPGGDDPGRHSFTERAGATREDGPARAPRHRTDRPRAGTRVRPECLAAARPAQEIARERDLPDTRQNRHAGPSQSRLHPRTPAPARLGEPAGRGPRPGGCSVRRSPRTSRWPACGCLGLRAPIGQSLVVALALPGDRRVQLRCSVVRQDATGVAVEFDGLDWDTSLRPRPLPPPAAAVGLGRRAGLDLTGPPAAPPVSISSEPRNGLWMYPFAPGARAASRSLRRVLAVSM